MGILWWQTQTITNISGGGGGRGVGGGTTNAVVAAIPDHRRSCYCLRRLLRKLKKHSKTLCSATRPTTFRCHYDPQSYARNFDCSGYEGAFSDDSDRFFTFSSRFAAPSSAPPVLAMTRTH